MNNLLNLKDTIIKYTKKRLECDLNPKPLYPCNNYKLINNYNYDLYNKKDFDLHIKKLWDHFNKCKKCENGIWYNYNNKKG